MSTRFYDTDLTNAAWTWVAPVLPAARAGGRPRTTKLRAVLERHLLPPADWLPVAAVATRISTVWTVTPGGSSFHNFCTSDEWLPAVAVSKPPSSNNSFNLSGQGFKSANALSRTLFRIASFTFIPSTIL